MTDPENSVDQAARDRIARLQSRRRPQPDAASTSAAPGTPRRRRRHPAIGGRIAAAGVGATAMLGITAALALEATANSSSGASDQVSLAPPTPVETAGTAAGSPIADHSRPPSTAPRGPDDTGGPVDFGLAGLAGLANLPAGSIITGELSAAGRPIVVVLHGGSAGKAPGDASTAAGSATGGAISATAPALVASPAPAPSAAAPTQLTATRVVTQVAVPAPAPTPTTPPAVTTSGS